MVTERVAQRFARLTDRERAEVYNYRHFWIKHVVQDGRRLLTRHGIQPGDAAPDFELPLVGGGMVRLSALRGQPVLLHFGSYT